MLSVARGLSLLTPRIPFANGLSLLPVPPLCRNCVFLPFSEIPLLILNLKSISQTLREYLLVILIKIRIVLIYSADNMYQILLRMISKAYKLLMEEGKPLTLFLT